MSKPRESSLYQLQQLLDGAAGVISQRVPVTHDPVTDNPTGCRVPFAPEQKELHRYF